MATLAKLVVKLVTDVSEFEAGMTNASKKMTKIGDEMKSIGDKMTAFVTLPILAVGAASIKMASDLNESMNKVDVVFGKSADAIVAFSKNSAEKMGLSKNAAYQAESSFGNLFNTMKIGISDSVDMSTNLTQLASDLASFNNVDVSDVLAAEQSGMVGMVEPLRKFGINLTEANVQAKGMAMGLITAGQAMTDQQKVMARYAIIMEQTKTAQGDFSRTSDQLANSTRIVKAEFEDTLASFGQGLLPVATMFMRALIPILTFFNDLPPQAKMAVVVILMMVAALGPLISTIGTLITAGGSLATMLGTGGALAGAGTFINTVLIPGLLSGFTGLLAILTAVSAPVWALLAAIVALGAVIVIFGNDAKNSIQMIWNIVIAFSESAIRWLNSLGGPWANVAKAVQTVYYWIIRLDSAFLGLKIPSWLTPGSPTPFELGLKGINEEMARLADGQLPHLQAGLDISMSNPAGSMNPAAAISSGGKTNKLEIGNITIYGDLTPAQMKSLDARTRNLFDECFQAVMD